MSWGEYARPPPIIIFKVSIELKYGLIHLLSSFHGLAGEEPHKHLQEFNVVCTSMKPAGITEEQIKLRAFPFSLKDAAKGWLFNLPAGSVTTWMDMKRKFLESGGALMINTPREAWELLNDMAMNSQQFGPRETCSRDENKHKELGRSDVSSREIGV
ncbi:uncharacterized protein LOC127239161 [Andrographis paniculata]|uniref:uncharacterized protein LOC127239161 n=1 Tax=Andrographis paniculata TaxID=175694 RepID=UPI0021E72198|nr:uncharacterized protein LOC127239161 [Andrographis paniculata]